MSIVEVAKLAGLSHATVSRVINNRPGVSPATADAVHKAMEQIGYTPAAKRRGPRPADRQGVSTGNVGVLMMGTDTMFVRAPVTAAVFHSVEQALAEEGFNVLFAQLGDNGRLPPDIDKGRVDGLILHGYPPAKPVRDRLAKSPCVWLMSQREAHGYWGDRVAPDNDLIGQLAAEHLTEHGHRQLAYFLPGARHLMFLARAKAFTDTAEELGASVVLLGTGTEDPSKRARNDGWDAESVSSRADLLVNEFLRLSPRPTGLFVPRDRLTVRVYRSLRRAGIEPGRDVEIISVDNEPMLEALEPRPTTIDVDPLGIGRRAVEHLLWLMGRSEDSVKSRASITVAPRIVPGDDTKEQTSSAGPFEPPAKWH